VPLVRETFAGAQVGLDLVAAPGELQTIVRAPDVDAVDFVVVDNTIREDPERLDLVIPSVVVMFFDALAAESATSVALPDLLGSSIDAKEVALVGTCIGVYGDFIPTPPAPPGP
jgi:hypothetical protein